jgi:hypothetical protein
MDGAGCRRLRIIHLGATLLFATFEMRSDSIVERRKITGRLENAALTRIFHEDRHEKS